MTTEPLALRAAEETLEAAHTRRHTAYPEYKPSGVEWLGDVPEHWDVKRLKFLAHLVNAKVEADEETKRPYIGMEHIESWTGKLRLPDDVFVPMGVSNVFRSGDVLFGKLRPYLAKATTTNFDGLCSSELMVLRSEGLNRQFLLYALLSDGFIKLVNSSTYGSKMPRANWEFVGGMSTPVPPPDEQQAIACFLDEQTRKIDDLIEAKRGLLALLKEKRQAVITHAVTRGIDPAAKLKPSGVEWLGDVPEHWDVKPLKHIASINDEALPETIDPAYEFDYVDIGNVNATHGIVAKERMIFEEAPSRARRVVREGDTIVSTVRTYLRAVASVREAADDLIVSTGFAVVRPHGIDPAFLSFALRESHFIETVVSKSTGVSYPAINASEVGRIFIPVPPLEEQRAIARFLDDETEKMDDLESVVREAIASLELLRVSIISAAVTGKIDV